MRSFSILTTSYLCTSAEIYLIWLHKLNELKTNENIWENPTLPPTIWILYKCVIQSFCKLQKNTHSVVKERRFHASQIFLNNCINPFIRKVDILTHNTSRIMNEFSFQMTYFWFSQFWEGSLHVITTTFWLYRDTNRTGVRLQLILMKINNFISLVKKRQMMMLICCHVFASLQEHYYIILVNT